MLFTNDEQAAYQSRVFRSQGENPEVKYDHPIMGHNYRMTDLNAAIALGQFGRWEQVLSKRSLLAQRYSEGFKQVSALKTPVTKAYNKHGWFLYPVLVERFDRNQVVQSLKEAGIGTNVSWPKPIYEQKPFQPYFKEVNPVSKNFTDKVICLPLYFEMTEDEQNYVINTLCKILSK